MTTLPVLPINKLADRHVGLTPALAETYLEAASVCLNRHHEPPQEFSLKNERLGKKVNVVWVSPDERCCRAWANIDDAARDGAYACAIAGAELLLGLFAVRRAETLTGSDYYVSPVNQITDDLETCYRLEVSGTNLDIYEVKKRLKVKVIQAREGQSNLPAFEKILPLNYFKDKDKLVVDKPILVQILEREGEVQFIFTDGEEDYFGVEEYIDISDLENSSIFKPIEKDYGQ